MYLAYVYALLPIFILHVWRLLSQRVSTPCAAVLCPAYIILAVYQCVCVCVCVCVCAGMFHPSCISDVTRHHVYIYIHAHIPVMCVCVFETVGNPSSGSVSTELYSFIIK